MIRAVTRLPLALSVAALVLLVAAALRLPLRPHGDAGEYLLMLESWHRHGSPELQPQDRESLRGLLAREGLAIDEDRVLPNYHAGRDGRLYAYHFWAYSLAGVPARRLLEARGLSPLRALPVTNALLFGLALVAVALLPWTGSRRLALGGLLLLSPALGFLMWPHPEVFTFGLVTLALVLAARGGHAAAVLSAALASLQNPPLVLLVAILWAAAALAAWRKKSLGKAVLATLAAVPGLLPAAFFQWQFGVFNLSVRPSEAAESLSALRALDLAIDPNLGLLPHAPLDPPPRRRRRPRRAALEAGDAGPARPRPAPAPRVRHDREQQLEQRHRGPEPLRRVVAADSWLSSRPARSPSAPRARSVAPRAGRWRSPWPGRRRPSAPAAALSPDRTSSSTPGPRGSCSTTGPSLYRPAPEVFVERTLHHEGPFEGPVVYRDAAGRCRKAWLQWRHAEALVAQCGEPPGPEGARLRAHAGRRETKRDWTYVDY